jgi:hypothetical protein
MIHEPFAEFALLLLIAAVVGAVAVRLRQPVLIAYIIVGIAVGPAGLELVKSQDQIDLLAQVGVAVLLFLVGLKLDLPHVRHIGPVALATGLGQLAFTIVIGFVLILLMGRDWLTALYVAVALTFSSTIIMNGWAAGSAFSNATIRTGNWPSNFSAVPRRRPGSLSSVWAATVNICSRGWRRTVSRCWVWISIRKPCGGCNCAAFRYASGMARTRRFWTPCR